ncbi:hypothetical protein BST81_00825 [Leptolyngbya sp. 'hensonii']|uniref:non-ribosomal peptide synthetase n=1 Tax=Leptolyngbya sp. 'hensonii' TaxID=1922337 RepID=UPI00094FB3C0|nr:non-ribosomal peptide synthetase [Leptolyngbya sp. 'hensonii']OLP20314.1 hypothetical protein BST81_00825 [Leptolyngbya sp. 'hensonii']
MSDLLKRLEHLSPEKRELLLKKLRSQSLVSEGAASAQASAIPLVSRTAGELPLSFAQQRLWFLDQLEGQTTAYNIAGAARLIGKLHVEALERAISEIIHRHEVLRTTFPTIEGVPTQRIAPPQPVTLPVTDLQSLPPDERAAEVQRLSAAAIHQTFDLATGPLLQASLLKLEPEVHVLLVTMHHIVSDGWSIGVFMRESSALYGAFSRGESSPLPELPIQYADFAAWQRQSLQGETLTRQLTYWMQQLQGTPPLLDLPTDRPRPPIQIFRGGSHVLEISPGLTTALRSLSRQAGSTLFMTTLAAFKLLLRAWTHQEDIVVGTPVAGRNRLETEGLIGFFINTLVLRTDLSGQRSFRELLQRVREVTLGAFAHQDTPFEKLVEELHPTRNLSYNPIFQVWFNMLNLGKVSIDLPGLQVEPMSNLEVEAKFDLTLYVGEQDDSLKLTLVYNAELFDADRMAELLAQYRQLLEQAVAEPDAPLSSFSLVTPAARTHLPDPTLPLSSEWFGSIPARVTQQAQQRPDPIALVDDQGTWSYAELEAASNQLAHCLLNQGIQSQEVVAVYAHRSASLVWALLGILKAGAAFLILDPAYPPTRLVNCLQQAQPQGWLQLEAAGPVPTELAEAIETLGMRVRLTLPPDPTGAPELSPLPVVPPPVTIDPDALAYVAFTSGSTGKPKGILGTHRPLSHFLKWQTETFDLQPADRFSLLSGLSHDPLLRDLFTPLWLGATVCIPTQATIETPGRLATWLAQQQVTVLHLSPALGQLLTDPNLASQPTISTLPQLRYAFFGGDRLTQQDVLRLRQLAPTVTCINCYGTTETPQIMGHFIVPPDASLETGQDTLRSRQMLPIGRGIRNTQLLVLRQHQLVGVGEVGEIYVRTPYLSRGYLGDEALTQERYIPNPFTQLPGDRLYRTGDLGYYRPDGNLEFLGRQDHQVILRGFRIELDEITAALRQHPQLAEILVTVREDQPGEKRLVAYLLSPEAELPPPSDLRQFLQTQLPAYMIPSAFVRLEHIPLTPNGKVDYAALPAPAPPATAAGPTPTLPQDEVERQLTEIWERVLGLESIRVTDNFFDLGGHSLQAVRLFAEIEKAFGRVLPLATFFQAATIRDLAAILRQEKSQVPWSSLVPLQPNGTRLPLFLMHAGGGNLLIYRDLVNALDADQPVYGLQPIGLDGSQKLLSRLEDMASYYIAQMREMQPEGPYFLAGLSTGGAIAWEIARQLDQQGQTTALLAMFDTHGPGYPQLLSPIPRLLSVLLWVGWDTGRRILRFPFRLVQKLRKFQIKGFRLVRRKVDEEAVVQQFLVQSQIEQKMEVYETYTSAASPLEKWIDTLIIDLLKRSSQPYYANTFATGLYRNAVNTLPEALRKIHAANLAARKAYTYQPAPVRVTLFRAQQRPPGIYRDPYLGWKEMAVHGIEIHDSPGNHISLLRSPVLARKFKRCLEKAQIRTPHA